MKWNKSFIGSQTWRLLSDITTLKGGTFLQSDIFCKATFLEGDIFWQRKKLGDPFTRKGFCADITHFCASICVESELTWGKNRPKIIGGLKCKMV